MQPPDRSLDILESMLAELEAYFGSAELFWPLALRPDVDHPYVPRLTIGNVILALDELEAVEGSLTPSDRTRLSRQRTLWETSQTRHRVALERKAGREIEARWKQWQTYLTDLSERDQAVEDYRTEVRNRLIISRLMESVDPRGWPAQVEARLQASDRILRAKFRSGAFVLAQPLKERYPESTYWYLYGAPATSSTTS